MRGGGGCRVSATEYSCAHGAQINFGDLASYLTSVKNIPHRNQNILYRVVKNNETWPVDQQLSLHLLFCAADEN
jgi:hypothetical protein